ncbi:hypothetical protein, partial [Pseudomonas helleri]|uniref:hypothetical protein n=1 Tax=Pseudomonas helleri TaxID=1608996 RepID=UPI003FD19A55
QTLRPGATVCVSTRLGTTVARALFIACINQDARIRSSSLNSAIGIFIHTDKQTQRRAATNR